MINRTLNLIAMAGILTASTCLADDVADKGRDIFKKNQRAVVTLQAVIKTTYSGGGRSSNPTESKQDITGTVIDPSGLTVTALSSMDPAELYRLILPDNKGTDTEVNELKILLEDGTEMPAEIVLRDKDLDLAFIRPKTKPSAPMAAVDLTKASPVDVLDSVIALNRLNRASGRAYSVSEERISAVIQKPRTFYIPATGPSSATFGSPVFALNGNIVGIFVMRAVSAGGAAVRSQREYSEYVAAILIPASDILKGAKQAPEAKGETEKPADTAAPSPPINQPQPTP